MKLSTPSPSMVVACVALVFAATGTGIAASSSPTDQKQLVKQVTKQLQKQADWVKEFNLDDNSVGTNQIIPSSVTLNDMGKGVMAVLGASCGLSSTLQASGAAATCQQGEKQQTDALSASIASIKQAQASAGPQGAPGTPGASAGFAATARVTVPTNVIFSQVFAPTTGVTTAVGSFAAAQTATPSVASKISDIAVRLVRPSASNPPFSIIVTLVIDDGTPRGTAGTCSFNPQTTVGCTIPGPIDVPANATAAWIISTTGQNTAPPPAWGDYDLSLGFRSTTA